CHLCRSLGVIGPPRELIRAAGLDYLALEDEEVCCGFGGLYSLDFPEVSAAILKAKLDRVQASGAEVLATDCPGCVLQLRGGLERRGSQVEVKHLAEVLAPAEKKE
ncbi:MAG: (Fe-S)-binding protein, partial [Deltaproteobacteria bacterium]|nr:(Fe-S)-binding protein [Deltaproteobacteria bacterium]